MCEREIEIEDSANNLLLLTIWFFLILFFLYRTSPPPSSNCTTNCQSMCPPLAIVWRLEASTTIASSNEFSGQMSTNVDTERNTTLILNGNCLHSNNWLIEPYISTMVMMIIQYGACHDTIDCQPIGSFVITTFVNTFIVAQQQQQQQPIAFGWIMTKYLSPPPSPPLSSLNLYFFPSFS